MTFFFARAAAALSLSLAIGPVRADCGPQALGVARVLRVGPTDPVGFKSYPRSLELADKELVLTFDDGPVPGPTTKVLDALKAECARATFFMIGRNAAANPQLARRIVAEGHTLAHHSMTHPSVTLRNLSQAAAQADILKGMEADDRAAFGEWSGAPRVPFFRFPGFGDSPALDAWLKTKGVTVFGADLWSSDWTARTAKAQLDFTLERIEHARKGVLLMHDIKPQTADSLPALLRELKARGYRIVHVVPGEAPAPLEPAPRGWTSETERTLRRMFPDGASRRRPGRPAAQEEKLEESR